MKKHSCWFLLVFDKLLFFAPQIADVQVQVSQNTEALQGAQMEKSDLSRQIQTLEIELASQQSLVRRMK